MRPATLERYLDRLSGQLPGPVVEELADGLEETWRRYLGLGLAPEAAAQAAVAEFGASELIAAEFARTHPATRPSVMATYRWAGSRTAVKAAQPGAEVSNVAWPSSIPAW